MSQSLHEITQLRVLLQLALERLDVLERQVSQSPNVDRDENNYSPQSQNSECDKNNYLSQAQNLARDEQSFLSASQKSESDKLQVGSQSQNSDRMENTFPSQSQNSDRVEVAAGLPPDPSPDALYRVLRAGVLKGMPRRSIKSAAMVLLHLRKYAGRHGYRELAPIAGLGERSLVVHMGALRRRGLLEKVGFQQYALTADAMAAVAAGG